MDYNTSVQTFLYYFFVTSNMLKHLSVWVESSTKWCRSWTERKKVHDFTGKLPQVVVRNQTYYFDTLFVPMSKKKLIYLSWVKTVCAFSKCMDKLFVCFEYSLPGSVSNHSSCCDTDKIRYIRKLNWSEKEGAYFPLIVNGRKGQDQVETGVGWVSFRFF